MVLRKSTVGQRVHGSGFTLLEVLVSTTILVLLVTMMSVVISQLSATTGRASSSVTTFQEARGAFDRVRRQLSQATLNTYWDYDDKTSPTRYLRFSELHFLVQPAGAGGFPGTEGTGQAVCFQAALGRSGSSSYPGLNTLLNELAFYVQYTDDKGPFGTETRNRYRLYEAVRPTDEFKTYDTTSGNGWVGTLGSSGLPIAENVFLLLVWPMKSEIDDPDGNLLSPHYTYDSRNAWSAKPQPETAHQLPPLMMVTLVALDETTAARICKADTQPAEITSAVSGLFLNSNVTDYKRDLEKLKTRLTDSHLNFRVFSTTVPVLSSKM